VTDQPTAVERTSQMLAALKELYSGTLGDADFDRFDERLDELNAAGPTNDEARAAMRAFGHERQTGFLIPHITSRRDRLIAPRRCP